MPAGKDKQLPASGSLHFTAHRDRIPGDIDFFRRDWPSSGFKFRSADQTIDNARRLDVIGVRFPFAGQPENFVQAWSAKVAIEQKNAIALLGERDRVIGAGETFAFAWQCAGEERDLAFAFRSEE